MKFVKHILPLLLIAIVTVTVSQLLYRNMLKHEEKRCWQELSTTVQDINKEMEIKFKDEISKLHLIETIMISGDMRSINDIYFLHLDLIQPTTMFSRIDLLYPDNTIVSNGEIIEIDKNISFDDIKSRGEYLTSRKTDFLTGNPCVYYVLPVMVDNEITTVMIGVIDLNDLAEMFKPVIYNGEANICIIDSDDGNYIMDSWHDDLGNINDMAERKRVKGYEDVDFKNDIRSQKTGAIAFYSKTTGKPLYMYYTPFNMFGWQTAVFAEGSVLFSNLELVRKTFLVSGTIEVLLILIYFLWNIYLIRQLQKSNNVIEKRNEQLEFLSYRDMLTSLYNRHKYMETLDVFNTDKPSNIGVAYVDLNGLKHRNDSMSHESGDEYIRNAAKLLQDCFGECCYRIGGDEFVVLASGIDEADFTSRAESFKSKAIDEDISIAIGYLWQEKCDDPIEMVYEAEKRMYLEKQEYYKSKNISEVKADI